MRKIILDVGANKGQNVTNLRKLYGEDFTVYSFEPNPSCTSIFKTKWSGTPNVHLIEKAAYIFDGAQTFYLGRTKESSSLRDDKTFNMSGESIIVDCIDFSKWIKNNLKKEDQIILYMDIEGAEYDVLDKMIEEDLLGWFNEVYMEFHQGKLRNLDPARHTKIYNKLIETYKENVYIWRLYQHQKYTRIG